MYSLDVSYFVEEFDTIEELINYVVQRGMDPNHEITRDGRPTGEQAIELMQF
jgi:hypothetical protein|tara:strand:+ start:1580 stop:1735 length:156 start_codon:yes stop_codon:yes gene_type:complete